MKSYLVTVEATLAGSTVVHVKAESEDEAIRDACRLVESGQHDYEDDFFNNTVTQSAEFLWVTEGAPPSAQRPEEPPR